MFSAFIGSFIFSKNLLKVLNFTLAPLGGHGT